MKRIESSKPLVNFLPYSLSKVKFGKNTSIVSQEKAGVSFTFLFFTSMGFTIYYV